MLQGILPTDTRVSEALLNILSEEGEPVVLDSEARVEMETIRCRSLGEQTVVMADIPWEGVGTFTAVHPVRGALAHEVRVLPFNVGTTSGRPRTASALAAAATRSSPTKPTTRTRSSNQKTRLSQTSPS